MLDLPRNVPSQTGPESADRRRSWVCRLAARPAGDLPVAEFTFPGPLRDQLVAAILAGEKTTTTGLVAEYERENEPLPVPGCARWNSGSSKPETWHACQDARPLTHAADGVCLRISVLSLIR
jgi:hypothetical protein